jgi:polar amino acid transport system permease protein
MQSAWTLLSWGPEGWLDDLAYGVFITVSLAVATLPIGMGIGFAVALAKQSPEPTVRLASNIYTTIFRGLPELLTLFLVYFGVQIAAQSLIHLVDPEATIEINSFISGMVALGVVLSSYASEVFLSAFRAIPRGQYEGGYAIGLTKGQTMRLVVTPQLIRIALPGLANLWLVLLLNTALVSAIGLADILRQAGIAARVTKHAFLFFGVATLIYLALAIISSFGIRAIERAVGGRGEQR